MAGEAPGALAAFEALAAAYAGDPLVRLHLQRLCRGEHGEVLVMDEK